MAKFRISLKLQGLELEVEGTRDDLPMLKEALSQQFVGMLTPATDLAGGDTVPQLKTLNGSTTDAANVAASKKRRSPRAGKTTKDGAVPDDELIWVHDPAKWGTPLQSWTTQQKALWTLYVAQRERSAQDMTASQITTSFNKRFRQTGQIRHGNVARDLGKAKSSRGTDPALVSEDTTKNPSRWFLVDAGTKFAETLVAKTLNPTNDTK
ncbi:MAG: hypothetical protein ABL986_19260 [Vicinamibacterales bacterium]